MLNNWQRAEFVPLKYSLLVMWCTLLIFLLGPINWFTEWTLSEYTTIFLLIAYFTAFALGYLLRSHRSHQATVKKIITAQQDEAANSTWRKIINVTIFINLVLVFCNALLYSSTASLSELFDKAAEGLVAPGSIYYEKDASSRNNSIIVWITLLYSPLMYITTVASIYFFRSLSKLRKVCVLATFVIEITRWLSIGTNKGLFDIVLLFITYFLILKIQFHCQPPEKRKERKKKIRKLSIIVVVSVVLFFLFFNFAVSSRTAGKYNPEHFKDFPYNLVPQNLRFFVEKAVSYLVQGYSNMNKIIKNCDFQWTFGIGNSRFLMQITEQVFGIDLTASTYPYQLAAYGVHPLVSWHSAYSWFASDLTFWGVIFLMFFAGYYMCSLVDDIITKADPISMTLFYLMIMMVSNASCTNYVLAYSNSFVAFTALFFIRFLRVKRIRFVIR